MVRVRIQDLPIDFPGRRGQGEPGIPALHRHWTDAVRGIPPPRCASAAAPSPEVRTVLLSAFRPSHEGRVNRFARNGTGNSSTSVIRLPTQRVGDTLCFHPPARCTIRRRTPGARDARSHPAPRRPAGRRRARLDRHRVDAGVPRAGRLQAPLHRAGDGVLHRLLLRAAGAGRLLPRRHVARRGGQDQRGLPLRPVAVRDGLGGDGALRPPRALVRRAGARHRGARGREGVVNTALVMFVGFILVTLGITFWASRRTHTTAEFYSAGRSITGFQNDWAVAGDYMSAASFLGIAGLIAFYGYDGFMYSVGWLVAYLTVLLLVAEPLRNTGKFTMADVLAFRLHSRSVRTVAAISTLTVSLVYMIAQMVGAGSIVSLLIPAISFRVAIILVGALMLVYVIFGGMLATTWVQIVKAVLLMGGTILLSILVLARFGFSLTEFFAAVAKVTGKYCEVGTLKDGACPGGAAPVTRDFTQPGLYYHG